MKFTRKHSSIPLCSVVVLMAACSGGGSGAGSNQGNEAGPIVPELGAATAAAESVAPAPVTNTNEIDVPVQFDWSSDSEFTLDLVLNDAEGQPAPNTGVSVYAMPASALAANRQPTDDEMLTAARLYSGVSDANGLVNATVQAPGHVFSSGSVFVTTKLFGVTAASVAPLTMAADGSRTASWIYGPPGMATETVDEVDPNQLQDNSGRSIQNRSAADGNYYLQPFENHYHWFYGHMPAIWDNKCDVQNTSAGMLCRSDVQDAHIKKLKGIVGEGQTPADKYLNAESSQSNLVFNKKANVIVSFMHEGAGFRNTFGFFTYNTGAEPTDPQTLDSARILFPNTSYRNSGGYHFSGDSVSLGEIDPANGHNAVGFYLAADGWSNNQGQGIDGYRFYSLDSLNPEENPDDRKHMLLIANEVDQATNTRRLWVAVEDRRLDRDQSDRDYNDLIMQIDVYPADALVFGDQIPDTLEDDSFSNDADNDGVIASNDIDDNDPERAFERYYPGEDTWGTLLAEDNWPALGDFDMNDMVIRYRTREVYDSLKRVKDLSIEYKLEARGAAFHNGFAVSLGEQIFADNVASAELNGEPVQAMPDATALAYEIFNDTWAYTFEGGEQCWTYNTMSECPTLPATDFTLKLSFFNSVEQGNMMKAPYNPFLFAHKIGPDVPGYTRTNAFDNELYSENGVVRDIEIHMPYQLPTQGQDRSMFGTGDDATDGVEKFYVSGNNLPWIIDVPHAIDYPEEFVDISAAYPAFAGWAESGGTENQDWYRHMADDDSSIYNAASVGSETKPTLAASNGIVVSDNFQDQEFIPFNLQVRNTTGNPVSWEALLENVGYSTIPNLNLNGATMSTTENGDGTYNHLFSGELDAHRNIVMQGGTVSPFGSGSGLSLYSE